MHTLKNLGSLACVTLKMNRAMKTRRWKKKDVTEYVLMRSAILPALIITVDNTPWHVY